MFELYFFLQCFEISLLYFFRLYLLLSNFDINLNMLVLVPLLLNLRQLVLPHQVQNILLHFRQIVTFHL